MHNKTSKRLLLEVVRVGGGVVAWPGVHELEHLDVGHAPLVFLHGRALGDVELVEEREELKVPVVGGGSPWEE